MRGVIASWDRALIDEKSAARAVAIIGAGGACREHSDYQITLVDWGILLRHSSRPTFQADRENQHAGRNVGAPCIVR